jgi:hypothetical protein
MPTRGRTYTLALLAPVEIYGRPRQPGDIVATPSLGFAAHLVRVGLAEPADAHTAREVELGLLLQHAIPRVQ